MSKNFETIHPSALILGPATKVFRGVATFFEIRGHRAALVVPDSPALMALCKEWGIEAPLVDVAEPVVIVSRFTVNKERATDGLDDGLEDGLDDGL